MSATVRKAAFNATCMSNKFSDMKELPEVLGLWNGHWTRYSVIT